MSSFGLLQLPVPVPAGGGDAPEDAVSDPLLGVLLEFMKAVVNDECGDAWSTVAPHDPLPIAHIFAHNPDFEAFNSNKTPALYIWRGDDTGKGRYAQGYIADDGPISCLWIPPRASDEHRRVREPIRNGIKKALKAAFAEGRHKAWVILGDTYADAADYGSVLLKHAKLSQLRLGAFRAHELIIEIDKGDGGKIKDPYDTLFFTLEILELHEPEPETTYDALDHVEGTVKLGTPALSILMPGQTKTYQLQLALDSISPTSGPLAGGTTVTIRGKQFADVMELVIGGVLCTDFTLVDEQTATAKTGAGVSVGAKNVVLTSPSGESKTIVGGFTYV